MNNLKPEHLSPLTLAYVGDAVFELMVRKYVIKNGDKPASQLHKETVSYVNAVSQYKRTIILDDILTEKEKDVFKRGRNVSGNHIPKNITPKEYRAATGLETLFGYLYLKGNNERLHYIFDKIIAASPA